MTETLRLRGRKSRLRDLEELTIALVSDRRMADLHVRFLGVAGPTDVITFQHGEIAISVDTASRQAKAFRTSVEHEIRLYIVHGMLHLHGFDDTTTEAARRMMRTQERLLRSIAQKPSPSSPRA